MTTPNGFSRPTAAVSPTLVAPTPPRLAPAAPQPDAGVPDGWLTMYDQPRRMIVAMSNPRRINETAAQYNARLTTHVTAITTRALAAQGIGREPCAGVRPAGAVDDAKTDTVPTSGGGLSDAQVASISNTVASVLGQASSVVRAALDGSDARAMAQIQADASVRLAELRAEAQTTTDPDQTSAINAQINALQAAVTQISSQSTPTTESAGLSANAKLALGAGGVLLLVLVVAAMD